MQPRGIPDAGAEFPDTTGGVFPANKPSPLTKWSDEHIVAQMLATISKKAVVQPHSRETMTRKKLEAAPSKARKLPARPAGKLAGSVTKRTQQLSAANQRLEASLHTAKKEKMQIQELCQQAQGLHGRLRDLTRELINVQEAERKALSRTLHDEVLQVLVGIDFELSSLQTSAADSDQSLAAKVARAQRVLKSSLQAMQRFARNMRPSALDDFGLIAALEMHIGNLAVNKQVAIRLTASDEIEDLGSAQRTVLFRVAQEALENVNRHANASRVEVNVRQTPGAIVMEITDNGRAFPVEQILAANNPKQFGLAGMKERIEMIGGTLTIQSTPGTGTIVSARIPFTPEPRNPEAPLAP